MIPVKPIEKVTKKWMDRASYSEDEYKDGIKNPKKDWEKESLASKANYETAIRESISRDARGKGITKTGTPGWQNKAVKKSNRWAPGIAGAEDDYKAGMTPVLDTIANVTLPPKYPAGDPRNYERSKAVGTALHAKKISG